MRAPTAAFWAVVLCTIAACAFTEEPDPGHGQYCQQVQTQRRLHGNPVVPDQGRDAGIHDDPGDSEAESGPADRDGGDRDGGDRDGRVDGRVDGGDMMESDAGDGALDGGDGALDGGDGALDADVGPDAGAADASPPERDANVMQDGEPAPPDTPDSGIRPPPPGDDAGAPPPPIGEPC